MIELKCTEASVFEFDMQLNGGAVGAVPQVMLCIDISSAMGLTFPCVKGDHGLQTVKLPCFNSLNIVPGEYPCRIMVLLGETVFFPYSDIVVLKDDPKPVINTFARANTTVPPSVTINAARPVQQPAPTPPIQAAPVYAEAVAPQPPVEVVNKADVDAFSSLIRRKR